MTDATVSEIPLDAPEALVSSPEASPAKRSSWRRNWGYWVALGWIVLIVVLAVLAPILPLPDPNARGSSRDLLRKGPTLSSWEGIMGYDKLGRSILSRSIYGARVSLRIGFGAVAIGTLIGGFIGLLAGYFRRWFETVSNIFTDAMLAFPPLVLLIALAAALGQSATNITIGLAVLSIPTMARLARANTMVFAEREFITAARHGRQGQPHPVP